MSIVCEHGQLARQCDYCERDQEIDSLRSALSAAEEKLGVAREALQQIVYMDPDADWMGIAEKALLQITTGVKP